MVSLRECPGIQWFPIGKLSIIPGDIRAFKGLSAVMIAIHINIDNPFSPRNVLFKLSGSIETKNPFHQTGAVYGNCRGVIYGNG